MSGIQFLYCLFRSCFFFNPSILQSLILIIIISYQPSAFSKKPKKDCHDRPGRSHNDRSQIGARLSWKLETVFHSGTFKSFQRSAISSQQRLKPLDSRLRGNDRNEIFRRNNTLSFRNLRQRMSGIQFLYCLFRSCFFFNPSILDPDNNYQLSAVSFQQKNQKKIATTAQGGLTMTDHKLEPVFPGNSKRSFTPELRNFVTLLLCYFGTCLSSVPLCLSFSLWYSGTFKLFSIILQSVIH